MILNVTVKRPTVTIFPPCERVNFKGFFTPTPSDSIKEGRIVSSSKLHSPNSLACPLDSKSSSIFPIFSVTTNAANYYLFVTFT